MLNDYSMKMTVILLYGKYVYGNYSDVFVLSCTFLNPFFIHHMDEEGIHTHTHTNARRKKNITRTAGGEGVGFGGEGVELVGLGKNGGCRLGGADKGVVALGT